MPAEYRLLYLLRHQFGKIISDADCRKSVNTAEHILNIPQINNSKQKKIVSKLRNFICDARPDQKRSANHTVCKTILSINIFSCDCRISFPMKFNPFICVHFARTRHPSTHPYAPNNDSSK